MPRGNSPFYDDRLMNVDSTAYLGNCDVIDCRAAKVRQIAGRLAADDVLATAKNCFHFVRDKIKHSADFKLDPITCGASDVLTHGTGYCYAKSHLLCALLRANQIPAGLCYQRLSLDGVGEPYCLHGLNAAYFPGCGWYRMDARGNRDDIDARFAPPYEQLAFTTDLPGECDLPGVHIAPLPAVVDALRKYDTWQELNRNLPDAVGE